MVRYSFLVGLLHPRLHAGLSRRLRLLTRAPRYRILFGAELTKPLADARVSVTAISVILRRKAASQPVSPNQPHSKVWPWGPAI